MKVICYFALNKKGEVKGLEYLPVVQEFASVFPEEFPGLHTERELEFTIDLKPRTELIAITPY
jgi:hypothetical protein